MTTPPPRTSRLDPVIEILLIALLAFMPAAFGVVDEWAEAIAFTTGAGIALCLAVRAIAARETELRPSLACHLHQSNLDRFDAGNRCAGCGNLLRLADECSGVRTHFRLLCAGTGVSAPHASARPLRE